MPRRRVLYIRHKRADQVSVSLQMVISEFAETLAMHADVTLMTESFDMDATCDRVQPDFIVYESPWLQPAPLNIANPRAHSHIPRFGLQTQDPQCATLVNFLRVAENLGICWIFSNATEALLRQAPELKGRVFSVSMFFDDRVFYDYGLKKDTPVSVFGGLLIPEIYRWRADTVAEIMLYFPTLVYAHPGYTSPVPRHKFAVMGEAYAKAINRSHFSLADTTRFDYVVRKHLEIPAAGAVLISPDAPSLKPYGFKDMENCILGSGMELFKKIAFAADNPDLYEKIRKNGYDLVHAKYTRKNWRGIVDFYECLRHLKPGETIRQQGFLGAFKAVPATTPSAPAIAADCPDSDISSALKDWWQSILREDWGKAQTSFARMQEWLCHMGSPWVPLGIAALLKGDLHHAQEHFKAGHTLRCEGSVFTDYDPEEIAWLSLTAALSGNAGLMQLTRRESTTMRHLSLRRVQWLSQILASGGDASNPPPDVWHQADDDHLSIYFTGQMDIATWLSLIRRILHANGQEGLLK